MLKGGSSILVLEHWSSMFTTWEQSQAQGKRDKKETEGWSEEEQREVKRQGIGQRNGQYILYLIKNYPSSDYFNLEFENLAIFKNFVTKHRLKNLNFMS